MKIVFIILIFIFSVSTYAKNKILSDSLWYEDGGPCLTKSCETGFLNKKSNIGISPAGSVLSKDEHKILYPEDWKQVFKSGEISTASPYTEKFQNQNLVQIFSFSELLKPFKKFGGSFDPIVGPAIDKFLRKTAENPVIFYAINGDLMMILIGSSDGKRFSYSTDVFKKKNNILKN